jgi:protein MpaA
MKLWNVWVMFVLIGCGSPSTDRPAVKTQPPPPQVIGYSIERRPIEMHNFGTGARPVLILGAIHGDEPTSATVTAALIELLRQYPQTPGNVPVAIIPVANPDGYAARTRTNVRRIDLNRNFPAKNFATTSRSRRNFGGAAPLSEPESAALNATIERLQPRLIISIHSMEKPCNNYDGPAQAIAELMSRYNRYPALASIGYPTPGSLGSYAGIDKQIPMITLELPRRAPGEQAWKENRDAILAAILAMK